MKIGDIAQARDRGVIELLANQPFGDGRLRYKLRKALEALTSELRLADQEREKIIVEVEPEKRSITPEHPRFAEVVKTIEGLYDAEAQCKFEPPFTVTSLDGVTLSVAQEELIGRLGLYAEEEPAVDAEPKPAKKPKVLKGSFGK